MADVNAPGERPPRRVFNVPRQGVGFVAESFAVVTTNEGASEESTIVVKPAVMRKERKRSRDDKTHLCDATRRQCQETSASWDQRLERVKNRRESPGAKNLNPLRMHSRRSPRLTKRAVHAACGVTRQHVVGVQPGPQRESIGADARTR